MRSIIFALALLVAPVMAHAQQAVPVPAEQTEINGYRVLAIAAGAVGGVVVANAVTGGLITPWLTAGMAAGGAPAMVGTNVVMVNTARVVVAAAGAVVGGYVGNWIYGK